MTVKHPIHLTDDNRHQEIQQELYRLLANLFGVTVSDEQNLREDLHADDLDFVEIVLSLENLFNIHITDEELKELAKLNRVADVVGYARVLVIERIQIVTVPNKDNQGN